MESEMMGKKIPNWSDKDRKILSWSRKDLLRAAQGDEEGDEEDGPLQQIARRLRNEP